METSIAKTESYRLKSKFTSNYIQPDDENEGDCNYSCRRLIYSSQYLKWNIEKIANGVMIKNVKTGKYMTLVGDNIVQRAKGKGKQEFVINKLYDGCCNILTPDGLAFTMKSNDLTSGIKVSEFKDTYDMGWGMDDQAFIFTEIFGY